MEHGVVDQLVARVYALLGEKLGVRGATLDKRIHRAGRKLPRPVRAAAAELSLAGKMASEPKMRTRVDPEQVSAAYDVCVTHLEAIDVTAQRSKARFDFAASVIMQFCVVGAATLGLLNWRGFL